MHSLHMHDAISYPHPHSSIHRRGKRKGMARYPQRIYIFTRDSHRGVSLLVIIHLSNRSAITIRLYPHGPEYTLVWHCLSLSHGFSHPQSSSSFVVIIAEPSGTITFELIVFIPWPLFNDIERHTNAIINHRFLVNYGISEQMSLVTVLLFFGKWKKGRADPQKVGGGKEVDSERFPGTRARPDVIGRRVSH